MESETTILYYLRKNANFYTAVYSNNNNETFIWKKGWQ